MSVKNRSIRLSIHNLTFNHPLPDHDDKHCFGDEIHNENQLFVNNYKYYTNNDSFDSILNSIHDSNTDKSSSSTISWGVGDVNETTNILKNELERMENILTGQQPIPHDYDANEYNKWMKYFPRFCIIGVPLRNSPKFNNNFDYFEEIIAIHPDESYQNQIINESSTISEEMIKETLIEHIYNKLSKTLLKPESPQVYVNHKSSQISSNLSFSIDDYLKVSPLSSSSSSLLPQRHTQLRRGHSSKSLISSQISSAKWLKDETNDYTSLPFLDGDNNNNHHHNHLIKDVSNKKRKSLLKSRLVLPPIDQFRSISATPRVACCNKYTLNLLTINGDKLEENVRDFGKNQSARKQQASKRMGEK